MRVAVLYSGGKDSTLAVHEALNKGWEVEALIAVKPNSPDAYVWHYATVEWTVLSAQALRLPLYLLSCERVGIEQEVKVLEKVLKYLQAQALLLGGVGLQRSQIRAVKSVARKHKLRVLLPHRGRDHYELFRHAVELGYEICITQVAAEGLGPEWLGKTIGLRELEELKQLSEQHGFHIGFEGGHAETFVLNGPIYERKIEFLSTQKVWDVSTGSGYLEVKEARLV